MAVVEFSAFSENSTPLMTSVLTNDFIDSAFVLADVVIRSNMFALFGFLRWDDAALMGKFLLVGMTYYLLVHFLGRGSWEERRERGRGRGKGGKWE